MSFSAICKKLFTRAAVATTVTLSSSLSLLVMNAEQTLAQSNPKFLCGTNNGTYITYVLSPQGKPIPVIEWVKWAPGTWNHRARCLAIASRFNGFYANGQGLTLRSGVMNNYPVICRAKNERCTDVAITFPLGTNAEEMLERFKLIAQGAGVSALQLSQGINAPIRYDQNGKILLDIISYSELEGLPFHNSNDIEIVADNTMMMEPWPQETIDNSYDIFDEDGVVNMDDFEEFEDEDEDEDGGVLFEFD